MTVWPSNPDDEVLALIDREVERQNTTLQLIASENFTSPAVLRATGSVLTNKYSEGYPGKRYYGGNEVIDEVEDVARERAKALFNAPHANVQPHAGANANMAVYLALLQPGDTVLGLRLDQGGHLTHGSPVNASGKLYRFVSYGVTPSDERIDFDQVRDAALEHRPKIIVTGATAYPRHHRLRSRSATSPTRSARSSCSTPPTSPGSSPAGSTRTRWTHGADIMTLTTHKTLRGPRGGAILCTAELAEVIDKSVFPGLQGGPLDHVDRGQGARLRRGGHAGVQGLRRPDRAQRVGARRGARRPRPAARVGRHRQPPDARRPPHLRPRPLGQEGAPRARQGRHQPQREHRARRPAPALHHARACASARRRSPPRAWARAEMATIAELIHRTLVGREDDAELAAVKDEVLALCSKFAPYPAGT